MNEILERQRAFFKAGKTLPYAFRKESLLKLRDTLLENREKIEDALHADLNKERTESYMTELGLVLSDISHQIRHLRKNMKRQRAKTPLAQFKGTSFRLAHPYGNVLIIAPWNYPILLTLGPLVGALAAGNTAVLKPSEYSPKTTALLQEILGSLYPQDYVHVTTGGREITTALLQEKWDDIFFTGGERVGKIVYEAASRNLTPVTLELGGKSPVIVDRTAKIDLAAKRIVFGKFINAGQTCVAPDYVLVQEDVREKFLSSMKKWIGILYPNSLENDVYPKIINAKHFDRLLSLLQDERILLGGKSDREKEKIEPTLLDPRPKSPVMNEEIFGPLLPVLSYKDIEEAFSVISLHPTPLALYLFCEDRKLEQKVLSRIQFGGGCINDTLIHLATNDLPFGGVGTSGLGCYHGRWSFETFSHYRSIVKKATWIDLPFRYTPYTDLKRKLIEMFLK